MKCTFENCGYYTDGECNICGMGISGEDTFCRLCKDNPNCYYKQLAELKAENIKLKERNEKIIVGYIKLSERYKQTLQEIKDIAMGIMDDDIEESSAYSDARQILDLITKAEEEWNI